MALAATSFRAGGKCMPLSESFGVAQRWDDVVDSNELRDVAN